MITQNSYDSVRQFMLTMKQETPSMPTLPSRSLARFRWKLLTEEARETRDATDLVGLLDGILDVDYINTGTAIACGFTYDQLELGAREVHRSNMSKLWRTHELERLPDGATLELVGRDDGGHLYVAKSRDGKVIKSPFYSKPNLLPIVLAK